MSDQTNIFRILVWLRPTASTVDETRTRKTRLNSALKRLEILPHCRLSCLCALLVLPSIVCWGSADADQFWDGPLMTTEFLTDSFEISHLEDHELLNIVRSRNQSYQEAAEVLTERLGGFLVSVICAIARTQPDDLADLTQQVWIRAFSAGDETFDTAAEFRAWLKSVARTRAIDLLRRRPHTSIPDEYDSGSKRHRENPQVVALKLCMKELETAKPEFAIVVCGICGGKSGQQLSAELGISPNTVYSRFDRSKMMLKECVERRLA